MRTGRGKWNLEEMGNDRKERLRKFQHNVYLQTKWECKTESFNIQRMLAKTGSIFRVDNLIIRSSTKYNLLAALLSFTLHNFVTFKNTPCSISSLTLISTAI